MISYEKIKRNMIIGCLAVTWPPSKSRLTHGVGMPSFRPLVCRYIATLNPFRDRACGCDLMNLARTRPRGIIFGVATPQVHHRAPSRKSKCGRDRPVHDHEQAILNILEDRWCRLNHNATSLRCGKPLSVCNSQAVQSLYITWNSTTWWLE